MKRYSWSIVALPVLLLVMAACTSYQLTSGPYTMSMSLPGKQEAMPKQVVVTVEETQVLIKNNEQAGGFSGSLDGDKLMMKGSDQESVVEFMGTVYADNSVKGQAVQKKGDKVAFTATFTLIKNEGETKTK